MFSDSSSSFQIDLNVPDAEWEAFWKSAVNGNLFHSKVFLSYHPESKFLSHHIGVRRKGNLVLILTGAIITEKDGSKTFVSHPGASYGGPCWHPKMQFHHLLIALELIMKHCQQLGLNAVRMTPAPVIYSEHHDQVLQFCLIRLKFSIVRNELTQAVSLDFDKENLLESFVNKTRTALRQAHKYNLKFRILDNPSETELDKFWEILVENRAGLGVVPAHNRAEIAKLHQLLPDNLMMAVAEKDGEWAAVIWNFVCNRHTVLEFYMAHVLAHQHLKPVPFLTYKTMIWAQEQGIKYLDFGISSIWGEPTWGLLRFKENFGSKHYLRQTWELRF